MVTLMRGFLTRGLGIGITIMSCDMGPQLSPRAVKKPNRRPDSLPERRLSQGSAAGTCLLTLPLFLEKLSLSYRNMRWKAFSLYHS